MIAESNCTPSLPGHCELLHSDLPNHCEQLHSDLPGNQESLP